VARRKSYPPPYNQILEDFLKRKNGGSREGHLPAKYLLIYRKKGGGEGKKSGIISLIDCLRFTDRKGNEKREKEEDDDNSLFIKKAVLLTNSKKGDSTILGNARGEWVPDIDRQKKKGTLYSSPTSERKGNGGILHRPSIPSAR